MKINKSAHGASMEFGDYDHEPGEVLQHVGSLWVVTDEFSDDGRRLCVDLANGELCPFDDDDAVVKRPDVEVTGGSNG